MHKSDKTEIADILCEFFEAVVHNILYVRKLYPQEIFVPKKLYGIIVHQSEHPLLNQYISNSLKAAHFHMKNNQLRKLNVCFISHGNILETFVFEVLQLQNNFERDPLFINLQESLRSLYLKLNTSYTYLNSVPQNAEFCLQLHVSEHSALSYNADPQTSEFPWAQISPTNRTNSPEIIPIHTIDTESIITQVYIEKYVNCFKFSSFNLIISNCYE